MATKTKVRAHNDIPWNKIRKMWDNGKSYEFMAKAVDRFDPKSADPTKPMRAIISRGLTVGFKDETGKVVKLKPREGMRAIGVGKSMHKAIKKAAKVAHKTVKVVGKGGRKPSFGKSIAIALDESGKFVRVELDKPKALVSFDKVLPSIENILHAKGLQVVPVPQATVAPVQESPAPVVEAPAAEKTTEPQAQPVAPSPDLPPVKSDTEQVNPAA